MLYIIGLGLGDERDITLSGLEADKKSQKIYMEAYTSLLSFGLSSDGLSNLVSHLAAQQIHQFALKAYIFFFLGQEKFYGKPITLADREMVEEKAGEMIEEAIDNDIAFLVVGDPFGYVE